MQGVSVQINIFVLHFVNNGFFLVRRHGNIQHSRHFGTLNPFSVLVRCKLIGSFWHRLRAVHDNQTACSCRYQSRCNYYQNTLFIICFFRLCMDFRKHVFLDFVNIHITHLRHGFGGYIIIISHFVKYVIFPVNHKLYPFSINAFLSFCLVRCSFDLTVPALIFITSAIFPTD